MPLLHIGVGGASWLDWAIEPDVVAICLALEAAYLHTVFRRRAQMSDAGRVKRSQVILFTLGVLAIYAASGSPLHQLSEDYLASAHMLQHVLLMLVAAPLLLAGVPGWLWQALLSPRGVLPVARVLTHPLAAIVLFNTVLLMTHLPSTIDLQVHHWWFHLSAHALQVFAGILMWWPILSPLEELPRISYPLQMAYLFVQSLLPAVLASFVTFSHGVVYDYYAQTPRIWGISPLDDQQIAGGLMKLLGSLILWAFIAIAFFKWYGAEEAAARGPRWPEVESELDSLGLKPQR